MLLKPLPIILITVDALRSDHLGCYGYKRATSPYIDKIAAEGVLFSDAVSGATFTHPSLIGLLASRLIKYNMFKTCDCILEISNDHFSGIVTLPELLRAQGYQTGFFGPYILSSVKCFERSFNDYGKCPIYFSKNFVRKVNSRNPVLRRNWLQIYRMVLDFLVKRSNESADVLTHRAVSWIRKNKNKPFFLWLHYFDVHAPFRPPRSFKSIFLNDGIYKTGQLLPIQSREKGPWGGIPDFVAEGGIEDVDYYISQYDAAIAFVDQQVGILMDTLRKEGLEKDALIIFTADHGTCLGENGVMAHSAAFPSEVSIKVPLIIKQKELFEGGVVSSQIQNIDIAPTILDILHLAHPPTMQGESFLPFMGGQDNPKNAYAFMGGNESSVIRGGGYKLIRLNKSTMERMNKAGCFMFKNPFYDESGDAFFLFSLKEDPYELINVMHSDQKIGRELWERLEKWLSQDSKEFGNARPKADSRIVERLKSLGYL